MSVKKILDDMDYGLAPESPEEVKRWLLEHNSSFGHFIGGKFTKPKNEFISVNPSNGEFIASLSQALHVFYRRTQDFFPCLKQLIMVSQ